MAATKKSNSKTTSGAAKGPVDEALKAKWEKAIDQYRAARDAETSGWDERYEALGDIVEAEPPLYLAGGYATMGGFLKAEVPGETERSVRRAIRQPEKQWEEEATVMDVEPRRSRPRNSGPPAIKPIWSHRQRGYFGRHATHPTCLVRERSNGLSAQIRAVECEVPHVGSLRLSGLQKARPSAGSPRTTPR